MIEEKLLLIMNDTAGEYKDGGYIVYSAEDDDLFLMSEFTFSMGDIFNRFLKGETIDTTETSGTIPSKAPKGPGWKEAGNCKANSLDVLKLSQNLSSFSTNFSTKILNFPFWLKESFNQINLG